MKSKWKDPHSVNPTKTFIALQSVRTTHINKIDMRFEYKNILGLHGKDFKQYFTKFIGGIEALSMHP